jgi:[amino group carrier protein]-lysine/ornithine hydrolase
MLLNPDEQLLHGAISLYSPSMREGAVAAYLVDEMERRGLHGRIDEAGNAVGEMGEGRPHIVLLGHIDTVPGPIPVEVRAGDIYGRGSVDAKGPFCAFVAAASRLAAGPAPRRRITLVGAVEEEAVTSKGARHVLDLYDPDYVVIGEPSGWDAVTLGYKGRLVVHYHLERPMAHTARRELVPAEEAVAFWQQIQAYCRSWNDSHASSFGQWGAIDPSLRQINSGEDPFVQTIDARMALRLPLGLPPDAAMAAVSAFAGDATVSFSGAETAVRSEKTTPLVRAFLASIRQAGGEPRFKVKTGTSDMNVVAARWRCPIVAYGPGDSSQDHTPQEHLSLDEYERAIAVLEDVLRRLAGP